MEAVTSILVILIAIAIYFIPSLNAMHAKHHNRQAIYATNLFLGWTFLGWVVALIWSFTSPPTNR